MGPGEAIAVALQRGVYDVDATTGHVVGRRSKRTLGCRSTRGYVVSTLKLDGRRWQVKLHQVVWQAVHGSIPGGLVVDHINRRPADNRITNLRLVDAVGNSQNRRSYVGEANPFAKLNARKAEQIRARHRENPSYAKVAGEYGVSKSLVAQIVRGEIWNK